MNMTRRILEGIHEVELEITPEFKKPAGRLSITVVDELLRAMGWEQIPRATMPWAPKGTMVMRVWEHPDIEGARIVATHPEGADHADEFYFWRADWGKQEIEPNLKGVEDTAKFLAASHGLNKLGMMGAKASSVLDQAMEAVGWGVVASSATVLVYEHPGVEESIEVEMDKDDNIVSALVTFPSGSNGPINPPTVEVIVARAEAVKSWNNL